MNDKSSTLVDMTIRGDGRGSKSWRRGGGGWGKNINTVEALYCVNALHRQK